MALVDDIAQKEIARLQEREKRLVALLTEARGIACNEADMFYNSNTNNDGTFFDAEDETEYREMQDYIARLDAEIGN